MNRMQKVDLPQTGERTPRVSVSKRAVVAIGAAVTLLAGIDTVGIIGTLVSDSPTSASLPAAEKAASGKLQSTARKATQRILDQMTVLSRQPDTRIVPVNKTYNPKNPASYTLQALSFKNGDPQLLLPLPGVQPVTGLTVNPMAGTIVVASAEVATLNGGPNAGSQLTTSLAATYNVPTAGQLAAKGAALTFPEVTQALEGAPLLELNGTFDKITNQQDLSYDPSSAGIYLADTALYSGATSELGFVQGQGQEGYTPDSRVQKIPTIAQLKTAVDNTISDFEAASDELNNDFLDANAAQV